MAVASCLLHAQLEVAFSMLPVFRDGCCMLSVACHPFNSESPGPLEGLGAMRRRGSGLGGLRGSPGVPGGPPGRSGGIQVAFEGGTAGRPRGRLGQRRSRAWAGAGGGVSSAHAATDSRRRSKNRTAPDPPVRSGCSAQPGGPSLQCIREPQGRGFGGSNRGERHTSRAIASSPTTAGCPIPL
jgi:hypothetical protein